MPVQVKLVDPNGKPKAMTAAHDRVASGKEFALFQSLLSVMALGSVPSDEFSPRGNQMARLIEPAELVQRAEEIVQLAMRSAYNNEWTVEVVDIDELYEDIGQAPVGFGVRQTTSTAQVNDDIPF